MIHESPYSAPQAAKLFNYPDLIEAEASAKKGRAYYAATSLFAGAVSCYLNYWKLDDRIGIGSFLESLPKEASERLLPVHDFIYLHQTSLPDSCRDFAYYFALGTGLMAFVLHSIKQDVASYKKQLESGSEPSSGLQAVEGTNLKFNYFCKRAAQFSAWVVSPYIGITGNHIDLLPCSLLTWSAAFGAQLLTNSINNSLQLHGSAQGQQRGVKEAAIS